jgi:MSHA biogenesis protein MshK
VCRLFLVFVLTWALHPSSGLAAELVDPTRPPQVREGDVELTPEGVFQPTYVLSSILISQERRIAIVNGVRVKPGDAIGNGRVLEISPRGVRIDSDGEVLELKLRIPVKIASTGQDEDR